MCVCMQNKKKIQIPSNGQIMEKPNFSTTDFLAYDILNLENFSWVVVSLKFWFLTDVIAVGVLFGILFSGFTVPQSELQPNH